MTKIHWKYPVFPDHTSPSGALPANQLAAQACWYFYLLAEKMREKVGKGPESQILLEGEAWMDTHYVQLARSIAILYQLESPDEFAKFWPYVKQEAWVCGLPTPHDSYTSLTPRLVLQ